MIVGGRDETGMNVRQPREWDRIDDMERRFQSNLGKLLIAAPLMLIGVTCGEGLAGAGQPWLGMRGLVECVLFPVVFGVMNGVLLASWRKGVLLFLFSAAACATFAVQLK